MNFENINPIIDADEKKEVNIEELKQSEIIDADSIEEFNANFPKNKKFNPKENEGDIAV